MNYGLSHLIGASAQLCRELGAVLPTLDVGNYATHVCLPSVGDVVVCSEMDPHDDQHQAKWQGESHLSMLKVIAYDPDYVIFHHRDGELVIEPLIAGKCISFNYCCTHGFIKKDHLEHLGNDAFWDHWSTQPIDPIIRLVFEFKLNVAG